MTIVYTIPAVRDAWADTAPVWNGTTGDIADPGNAFVAAGWQQNTVPPPYQYFNWVLNYCSNAVRYFMQNGIVDWQAAELYQVGAVVVFNNFIYQCLVNNTNHEPDTNPGVWGPLAGYATIAMLANFVTNSGLSTILGSYAPLNAPSFTGYPLVQTPPANDVSGKAVNTSWVSSALSNYALLSAVALLAPKANPAFTGIPSGPTAAPGTSTGQFATTQFVTNALTPGQGAGWVELPGGTIIQSGTAVLSSGGTVVDFPVEFPNECYGVDLTAVGGAAAVFVQGYDTIYFNGVNGISGSTSWIAMGK